MAAPAWMTDATARREWQRLAPELRELGLLTVLDVALLSAYCECFSAWRSAQEALEEADRENSGAYLVVSGIAAKRRAELARLGAEFGFSPSARTRVATQPAERPGKLLRYLVEARKGGMDRKEA